MERTQERTDEGKPQQLMSRSRILARDGWTPALITRFLDPPDAHAPNPRFRHAGSPMRLYALARVAAAERQDAWQQAAREAGKRSAASQAVAQRKRDELVAAAERLHIAVHVFPEEELLRRAIAAYNAYHAELYVERGWDYASAHHDSDPTFLTRIVVNYLRHRCTTYDKELEQVAGQVGVHQAIAVIRRRVYAAIADAYPQYAQECERQLAWRTMSGVA